MFPLAREGKKASAPFSGTKALNFCDTTQIDVYTERPLALRTIIRIRLVTGRKPVVRTRKYFLSVRPDKVHSHPFRLSRFHLYGTLCKVFRKLLVFVLGFNVWLQFMFSILCCQRDFQCFMQILFSFMKASVICFIKNPESLLTPGGSHPLSGSRRHDRAYNTGNPAVPDT